METSTALVTIVDDDPLVGQSLARLLRSCGFSVETYTSPLDFLECTDHASPGCLVVDLLMPGLSGLDLQRALSDADDIRPVIFISGRAEIASAVAALKAGAVDFVEKPIDGNRLLEAVRAAIRRDELAREEREARGRWEGRLETLTRREHQVLVAVVDGKLNKQIAAQLGTSEKTIKVHRARMMEKMCAGSVAGLVRAWVTLTGPAGIAAGPPRRATTSRESQIEATSLAASLQ